MQVAVDELARRKSSPHRGRVPGIMVGRQAERVISAQESSPSKELSR